MMTCGIRGLLLSLALLAGLCPATVRAQQPAVDLALVLAVDVSRSVDDDEFQLQRRGYADAFRNPAVIAAIRSTPHGSIAVTFMEWAGADFQRVVIPWTVISDAESGQIFADTIQREPRSFYGWTSISGAIDFAVRLIETSPFQSPDLRRVIDVSGDGVNNSGRPAASARDAAVARGIAVNGLVIMNDNPNPGFGNAFQPALDQFYRDNVIGGQGAFVIAVDDFESFAFAILNKLIREISALPAETSLAQFERPSVRIAVPGGAFIPTRRTIRAADAIVD